MDEDEFRMRIADIDDRLEATGREMREMLDEGVTDEQASHIYGLAERLGDIVVNKN